jgi:hypothetical protein
MQKVSIAFCLSDCINCVTSSQFVENNVYTSFTAWFFFFIELKLMNNNCMHFGMHFLRKKYESIVYL